MFKIKFIISITIFFVFLIFISVIKNKTRVIEKEISNLNSKILLVEKDINEAQLDFYYLTSPLEIEKKLNLLGINNYQPIKYSNIYLNISDLTKIKNKISNLNNLNDKKTENK